MASTLEKLIAQLQGNESYKPLTQEEIQKQAAQRYQSVYDQKRLSAQQTYESEDAALARELSGLQKSYDEQRASSAAQTKLTYSQADRHALSRGMQRSSYTEGTLANIGLAGDAAQREIDQVQTEHEAQIGEKRTLLNNQLSQTLRQLSADQQSDEQAYADELSAREYDRRVNSQNAANQLAMQLYEYQHQLEVEAAEQARWQAEFNARYGDGSSSSGGGGRGGSRKTASVASNAQKAVSTVSAVRKNQKEQQY